MNAKRALRHVRAPDEVGAEHRAWATVSAAYHTLELEPRRHSHRRFAVALMLASAVGAIALSPAGATVSRLITRALGVKHASPALFSLPAPGRLLVSGPGGTWAIARNGSSRRLGSWTQASWSPRGRYVAVAGGTELAAVDPRGVPHWALARPAISAARWYEPTGYRVAYLSGGQLRVVAGDGTGDRLVASGVSNVAPAWRPNHAYQLAFVTRAGWLVVQEVGSGQTLWRARMRGRATQLTWTGSRLIAFSAGEVREYTDRGKLASSVRFPPRERLVDSAVSPDGRTLALILGGQVVLRDLDSRTSRSVFTGAGLRDVVWAPDGRWLLVSWPAADQWVFIRVAGTPRIEAVSHVAKQFSGGVGFPQLDGWCCGPD